MYPRRLSVETPEPRTLYTPTRRRDWAEPHYNTAKDDEQEYTVWIEFDVFHFALFVVKIAQPKGLADHFRIVWTLRP
jgi:hypothetical protein